MQRDIFNEILPLCLRMNDIINDVFTNNERIMEQFIKDLFLGKVQVNYLSRCSPVERPQTCRSYFFSPIKNYIAETTRSLKETDVEKYLDTIYVYYNK